MAEMAGEAPADSWPVRFNWWSVRSLAYAKLLSFNGCHFPRFSYGVRA